MKQDNRKTVKISEKLHKRIKVLVANKGWTVNHFVETILNDAIKMVKSYDPKSKQ